MVQAKAIKNKITSIGGIKKITNALEVVSTVKLQKIKKQTESYKIFLQEYLEIIVQSGHGGLFDTMIAQEEKDTIAKKKERNNGEDPQRILAILITSEKGLCGSINTKTIKEFTRQFQDTKAICDVVCIGKKGYDFCKKNGYHVIKNISLSDTIDTKTTEDFYQTIQTYIRPKNYLHIGVVYTGYQSPLVQNPCSIPLYPFSVNNINQAFSSLSITPLVSLPQQDQAIDIKVEPSPQGFLEEIQKQCIRFLIYGALLQSKTSEFAARMVAMKNAKENSQTMIEDLKLQYNKARQGAVTQEISEIVGAKAALE